MRNIFFTIIFLSFSLVIACGLAAKELTVEDFTFNGPLGSEGTTIEKVGTNHFKVILGHAPNHPNWNNKLQFTIKQNAKGNKLRLDVYFMGGDAYIFNEYFHSWSYDGVHWNPVFWQKHTRDSSKGDTLIFPRFVKDTVYVGHQIPMSYEDVQRLVKQWEPNPCVKVHTMGQSLGGRNIYRVTITDPQSPIPPSQRWVHYFANQHPGEHNSQWRLVGMIEWLLSKDAQYDRKRTICHFVLMMSPDAPSHGWYRVNAEGMDMNRSYFAGGSDPNKQVHEAYIGQKDLEQIMQSQSPADTIWSIHTWGGMVEPICIPGPEMGGPLGAWTVLRDAMEYFDVHDLVEPLKTREPGGNLTYWTNGPNHQFGVTSFLCEGAGAIY
ncbi:hypothetical protein GF373_09685, partial [bacterium]|nr:hypothetical protein [bacterium]